MCADLARLLRDYTDAHDLNADVVASLRKTDVEFSPQQFRYVSKWYPL